MSPIRPSQPDDLERLLSIWLAASLQAHDFVPAAFWESQLDAMRHVYLPYAQVWVYVHAGTVTGFHALVENQLAAIFVDPPWQGHGMGKALLQHAQRQRSDLVLQVYRANRRSLQFYRSQGWTLESESIDEATGQPQLHLRSPRTSAG